MRRVRAGEEPEPSQKTADGDRDSMHSREDQGSTSTKPTLLFWTGGLDSTYRLCEALLVEDRTVQPIYVIDAARGSTGTELRAMQQMRAKLVARMDRPARLLPSIAFHKDDYTPSDELRQRFDDLASRTHVGSQYLWLGAAAEYHGWNGVELCIPRHEPPNELKRTVFANPGTADPTLRDEDYAQVFRYWSFPVLGMTKPEMWGRAHDAGFGDILSMRWFCFKPTRGRPCGMCSPCRIARADGVTAGLDFPSQTTLFARRAKQHVSRRLSALKDLKRVTSDSI